MAPAVAAGIGVPRPARSRSAGRWPPGRRGRARRSPSGSLRRSRRRRRRAGTVSAIAACAGCCASRWRPLASVLAYTALSAAYPVARPGAVHAGPLRRRPSRGSPLIVGMGVVEWRARRFGEQARALLDPGPLPRGVRHRGSGCCWLGERRRLPGSRSAVLAAALLVAAARRPAQPGRRGDGGGQRGCSPAPTSWRSCWPDMGRYGWLCGSLAASPRGEPRRAVHDRRGDSRTLSRCADTTVFLASALLLLLLLLAGCAGSARPRYR